jgi:coenzyme F420 hydrogenase subunit beta
MTFSPVLDKILGSDLCTGCGLCASLAPEAVQMTLDAKGFARPRITSAVPKDSDEKIEVLCPGRNIVQEPSPAGDHILWGPVQACRTGHATDADLRQHASSGGAISALLNHLLASKTVDFAIQVGASPDSPLDNMTFKSTSADNVYDAAGSRYAPSSPLQNIHEHLANPGRFALVGKPCDIAAIRAMARTDARIDQKIPVMISFFCAGVPSRRGTQKILEAMKVDEKEVVDFRYRGDGWPGFATARKADGSESRMNYMDSWGNILSKHVQFRCKICPDGSGGLADVVCADAWDTDARGYPLFLERDGQSLILSRTAKGEQLVLDAMTAGAITASFLDVAKIEKMQPAQANRKRLVLARLMALRVFSRTLPRYRNLNLARASLGAGVVLNVRNFLGLVRRLWQARVRTRPEQTL